LIFSKAKNINEKILFKNIKMQSNKFKKYILNRIIEKTYEIKKLKKKYKKISKNMNKLNETLNIKRKNIDRYNDLYNEQMDALVNNPYLKDNEKIIYKENKVSLYTSPEEKNKYKFHSTNCKLSKYALGYVPRKEGYSNSQKKVWKSKEIKMTMNSSYNKHYLNKKY